VFFKLWHKPKGNKEVLQLLLEEKAFSIIITSTFNTVEKMSEDSSQINPKHLEKLDKKAKELGYTNLAFFIDDIDMLMRPSELLKQKDMKYFELENLITLLTNKKISLGMAPRMISMVSKYSERNEELEAENTDLKRENITNRSKAETAEVQVKELNNQLQNLSVAPKQDAKVREENIKLSEENKYLKLTNDSLNEDLKKTKTQLDKKLEESNDLEVENSQLEMRIKDIQREIKDIEKELEEEQRKEKGGDKTLKKVDELIEELDELYGTVDDPFKKEFLAFLGVELSEIVDDRHITKQKILNQIAIHANEIEKVFEPKIAAMKASAPVTQAPTPTIRTPVKEVEPEKDDGIPSPVIRSSIKEAQETKIELAEEVTDTLDEITDKEDRYVKPSEFLKGKTIHKKEETEEKEAPKEAAEEKEPQDDIPSIPEVKKEPYKKKVKAKKGAAPTDRTPSEELIKVFDVFIKYLEAINDTKSFNDLCDKIIEQLYEHVGSPGMTQVYKIKSGGLKRKSMLVDILKSWKKKLPDM
jgi:myosin heavy subunit